MAHQTLDPKLARLLDASLNRTREGIRVVEDTARFVWDDAVLYRELRSLRHALHKATANVYPELIAARSVMNDVGRVIKESRRESLKSVYAANLRRAQEGARVLEEVSKVFSLKAPTEFKRIRYALYNAEKKVMNK